MTTPHDIERRVDDLEAVDGGGYSLVKLLSADDEGADTYDVVREDGDGYQVRDRHDGVVFHADETPEDALRRMLRDGTHAGGGAV